MASPGKIRLGGNNRALEKTLRAHKAALGWQEPPPKMACRNCGRVIPRRSANQKFCEVCRNGIQKKRNASVKVSERGRL